MFFKKMSAHSIHSFPIEVIMKNPKSSLLVLVAACLLILLGCSPDDSSDSPKADKNLFSYWSRTDGQLQLDFSGGEFGKTAIFPWSFTGGDQCNCLLTFLGTQSSGGFTLNNCTYQIGSGPGLINCSDLNQTGTFTKTADTLNMCTNMLDGSKACYDYK